MLKSIETFKIADKACASITSTDIVFVHERLNTGVQPQMASNYLSHQGAVFAIASPAWNYPLDRQAMQDAWIVADELGLTTKSKEWDRTVGFSGLRRSCCIQLLSVEKPIPK